MEIDAHHETKTTAVPLLVADWMVDPEAVVTTCAARIDHGSTMRIVVPAWLHGLDWAGDPWACVPCAQHQLERIRQLCPAAGLDVIATEIGDPDPVSAICDAVAAGDVDRILLFARGRHVSARYPLSVARRVERLTGLPVHAFATPLVPRPSRRRRLVSGHCEPAQTPQLA
jgi:hypothetical protein